MRPALQALILKILSKHKNLNLATLRTDGWPQVTTVAYVNDGMTLYFVTAAESQKINNIAHCNKVSLTIDDDDGDWTRIQGVSMAAKAELVTSPKEVTHAADLLFDKFPQIRGMDPRDTRTMSIVRLTPQIVSVLDYTKGFGHADLIPLEQSASAISPKAV
jgi:nitroimidazol reductase NimA-like FMN-containing flavoprotein (pyridoxamine 5'-phosphate oxidase superfamily)